MKKIVIIFGYNNTRIYDIERLKNLCSDLLGAEIMLCKEAITQLDVAITPYTLEVDLGKNDGRSINEQIVNINHYLTGNRLDVIACLPFSDKGIPLGSHFAKSKALAHDDCDVSVACIDKYAFRCLEKEASTPAWYKKPFFKKITTLAEARECVIHATSPLFFKPTSEGNSRGCLEINTIEDLESNIEIINCYLEQGIVVEECIKGCDEYSFDGVDGCYIITEKMTSQGYYRVETQHILPAPLASDMYDRLIEAGKIVCEISGSNHGAVHNELFLNKQTGEVYCVEPNRRPAGLKVWDWIGIAFPGTDNWKSWLNWATGGKATGKLGDNQYYVGCRMLQASASGVIKSICLATKSKLECADHVTEIVISKNEGQTVTNHLKDNSDFLGYIVCRGNTPDDLEQALNTLEKCSANIFTIG